jgi:hypothetical protein
MYSINTATILSIGKQIILEQESRPRIMSIANFPIREQPCPATSASSTVLPAAASTSQTAPASTQPSPPSPQPLIRFATRTNRHRLSASTRMMPSRISKSFAVSSRVNTPTPPTMGYIIWTRVYLGTYQRIISRWGPT